MIKLSILLGLGVFLLLIIIWYKGIIKKHSLLKLFLISTLFLFGITLLIIMCINILEEKNNEVVIFNQSINDELLHFALWYYQIPVFFLITTIIVFMQKVLKNKFKKGAKK